jgi:hypothetical protein
MPPKKFRPNPFISKGPELTDAEIKALRGVSEQIVVQPLLLQRLKALGLIEQKLGRWNTTPQGQIRLMFLGAR